MNYLQFVYFLAPFITAAIPLAITPGFLFYYDVTPKIVVLYLGIAAVIPFVNPHRLLSARPGRWFCLLLLASFVSALLSSIFSVRWDLSVFGSSWRRFGLLTQGCVLLFALFIAADLSSGSHRLRAYLRASTVATAMIALYGILQYMGLDPLLDPKTYHFGTFEKTIVRTPGTLGYVTYFANYLVFGAFQALALSHVEKRTFWRRAGFTAAALSATAIVLSGTRAAFLALLAGGVMLWLHSGRRAPARTIGLAGGVAVLAVLFYLSPAGLLLRGRMQWIHEDSTGGARLYLWRDSLGLIEKNPLTGCGPDTFSVAFPKVQSAALSRAFPEFYHESAHNIFLDAATAQGIPGLLVLLAAAGFGFRLKRKGPRSAALFAGFAAILIGHQFSVFIVPTALGFWISLAMLLPSDSASTPQFPDRPIFWLTPVSLVLIVLALRMTVADMHLAAMRVTLGNSQFDAAEREYREAARFGLHADLWCSRKLLIAGRTEQALTSGISATVTADDPYNAWMNLGLIYAKLQNANRTEYCIRQAIEASPNWYKPHLALAQLLLATGRLDEGRQEAARAKELHGR